MKVFKTLLAAILGIGLLIGAGAASATPMMNMTKPEVQSSVQAVDYRHHRHHRNWHAPRHHRHHWKPHRSYRGHSWRGHHRGWYKHHRHHPRYRHHRYYRA
jgi:Ni/Co efflux regulator RcnB